LLAPVCKLFEATLHATKQQEPHGLLPKDLRHFQQFPPERRISYDNLKSQLHTNVARRVGQLCNGIFIVFVGKDSHVFNHGILNRVFLNVLHYETATHFYVSHLR
jgi:hypothetical protein